MESIGHGNMETDSRKPASCRYPAPRDRTFDERIPWTMSRWTLKSGGNPNHDERKTEVFQAERIKVEVWFHGVSTIYLFAEHKTEIYRDRTGVTFPHRGGDISAQVPRNFELP
jgi:hypothetical protein